MTARWPDRLGSEDDRLERRADWLDDDDVEDIFGPPKRKLIVLRRIDLWSALKVSLALYLSLFVVWLGAGAGLWQAARHSGGIDKAESLVQELCCTPGSFHFDGGQILRFAAVLGPIFVVLASLATVAGVALFNLVCRLVGGVEVTVSDGDALPGR